MAGRILLPVPVADYRLLDLLKGDHSTAYRILDQFGDIVEAQFFHNLSSVGVDGFLGYIEIESYLL
jgi:hypothetical protein